MDNCQQSDNPLSLSESIYKKLCALLMIRMVIIVISFDPLWETMKKRGISQYKLLRDYHFSAGQLNRLRNNHNVNTYTLNQLCKILDCSIEEIAVYLPDDPDPEHSSDV